MLRYSTCQCIKNFNLISVQKVLCEHPEYRHNSSSLSIEQNHLGPSTLLCFIVLWLCWLIYLTEFFQGTVHGFLFFMCSKYTIGPSTLIVQFMFPHHLNRSICRAHHFFLDITNSVLYRKFACVCLSIGNGDMYINMGQRRIPGYSYNTVVYNILKWYQKSNCFRNIHSLTFYKLSLEHALICETHFWL